MLTTSRRTPIAFEQALAQYAIQHQIFNSSDQITWVAQGQQCDIKDYIIAADWVLSSQDSTSMMAEVVMAGRPLFVLHNAQGLQDTHIQQQLRFLAEHHWLAYEDIGLNSFGTLFRLLNAKNHSDAMQAQLNHQLGLNA